jgi:hypothetical protein
LRPCVRADSLAAVEGVGLKVGGRAMPIQRTISPDFQKPEICTFLNDFAKQTYDHEEVQANKDWQAAGYQFVPGGKRKLTNVMIKSLHTFVSRQCELYDQANRLVQKPVILDAIDHKFGLYLLCAPVRATYAGKGTH